MGWSIGFDTNWQRDVGYGVPAYCDHPKCDEKIDRGLGYVCGGDAYGGQRGCGLFFCETHIIKYHARLPQLCPRCSARKPPYKNIKPDHPEWINWKLTDSSWAQWRKDNPTLVASLCAAKGECK